MKVSINWLKDYIDIDIPVDEISKILTMAGFEVESVSYIGEDIKKVVVSEIVSISPHPNAEKLSLCIVNTKYNNFEVVCGAKNIKVGDRVPLALDGARLAYGVKIKKSKIRGVVSQGMLCSEKELGISEDAEGIMILPKESGLGEDINEILDIKDVILDINIPPNRPDCLSIIGIGREIGAFIGKKVKLPDIEIKEVEKDIKDYVRVSIVDRDLCPRYSARIISNIKIDESPIWLKRRLISSGIRPINNVVDITNYVLLETGHPLHAFDYELLEGSEMVVRRAKSNEKITTKDNIERNLDNGILTICDVHKPVAIAGIMGGNNSEIGITTNIVLLESAYFDPVNIRHSSKKLNLRTESSIRFERGVNPDGVVWASDRASKLISEICGGEIIKGVIDEYPSPVKPAKMELRTNRVNFILGTSFKQEEIIRCLKNNGMNIENVKNGIIDITPPPFRIDIKEEIDIIEDIARLMGYNNIPVTVPITCIEESGKGKLDRLKRRIKEILIGSGLYEVINYSFMSPGSFDKLYLKPDNCRRNSLKILNPLRNEESIMRTTLIPGLLETLKYNIYHKNMNIKIFELGKVFIPKMSNELPCEKFMLTGVLSGLRYDESWNYKKEEIDFFDVKGIIENLLDNLKLYNKYYLYPIDNIEYLHPGRSVGVLINDISIGYVGEFHPKVLDKYEIPKRVFLFDIDFDMLFEIYEERIKYKPIYKFPYINRDVALIVDKELAAAEIDKAIKNVSPRYLKGFKIFDIYEGNQIPSNKKSIAYRFKYQAPDRTLTDEEVNIIHEKFISRLLKVIKGEIRK